MKKLIAILTALGLLGAAPATATGLKLPIHHFHFHHHHAAKPTPGQAFSPWCTGGCIWVGSFEIFVATLILADEVKRTLNGPACATGKPDRRSYFGYITDKGKLWRPLCSWKGRSA